MDRRMLSVTAPAFLVKGLGPQTFGIGSALSAPHVEEATTGVARYEDLSASPQPGRASGLAGRILDFFRTATPAGPGLAS